MINLISILLSAFVLLYILNTLFILYGTFRLDYPKSGALPDISILIALRNEEANIENCVHSLLDLDYPAEKMEILLINDRSSDATGDLIERWRTEAPHIRTLHVRHGIKGLSGKANAIAQGMESCSGDIVLVTDGDCRVPKTWVRAHVRYYNPDVGMIGGFTLLDQKRDRTSLFGKIQSLDWTYLLSIGSGAIGMGTPLSVLGNNFSFRRDAYEAVGGYRNMGFTIIEDFALMKTLVQKTRWQVRYPIASDMIVLSHPMPTCRKFYEQRKRWSAGGKEVGLYGKLLMLTSYVSHILIPFSFLFLPPSVSATALLGLVLADFFLLWRTTGLAERRDLLRYFPMWELFYFVYTSLFAPTLLFPTTVTWKNIRYSWRFNWKLKKMTERS